ncbi:MAG: hypothetical protein JNG86_12080 [Verrucomicrobiaceae bacterium]|nr:hypothetical protein [Verrucomicrobiaceae bacterium]
MQAIRDGKDGPFFIECRIYRWKEHVGIGEDWKFGYRSKDEAQPWLDRDPLSLTAAAVGESRRQEIESTIDAEIADAFQFAQDSPFPDVSELMTDVYA